MGLVDSRTFLDSLAKCQLLNPTRLAEAQSLVQQPPKALARALMEKGWITLWQAKQLLDGRHTLTLGDYELLLKVGEGGMGSVYKARHTKTRRLVALKLMAENVLKQPGALPRFHREIRAAAALNHPHIVAAFDAAQVGDLHFLVMEYVEGRDLRNWLHEFGRLPIDWSCECISQAAEGLEHAHQQGFVHRDIKPGNLMVAANDTSARPLVKILDLGLARLVVEEGDPERITKTGHVLGTIDYMSPEQVADTRMVDIRGDIFSLGCTMFKALTGQNAFDGRTMPEKVMSRLRSEAPRASRLRPDVPPELDAVLARMLARDVENRFQRPSEVVAALQPFLMRAPPPSTSKSNPRVSSPASSPPPGSNSGTTMLGHDDQARIKALELVVAMLSDRLAELEEIVKREFASRI